MTRWKLSACAGVPLVALTLANGLQANDFSYIFTGAGQFGRIDLNTGAYSQFGSTGVVLSGLGVVQGALYGGIYRGSTLYQVSPKDGSLTEVGTSNISYCLTGSTTNGLLYAIDLNENLYSVNPNTAAATLIGPVGVSCGSSGSWWGMSTNSTNLYFTADSNLYTVNTSTGAATLVGNTGTNGIGAMVFEGGKLYAGVDAPFQLDTLNTSNGMGTFVANPSGNPPPGAFWALAPSILLRIVPTKLVFPSQTVGTTSSPKTVTLTNNGFVAMAIKGIETDGNFSESSTTCGATLPPKSNCTISVTFMPTETGGQTGTLRITDNAGGNRQTISLSGTGR